ncbi:MAG: N-acetylglucosamine-6-phosphate deacetylase [Bacteroidetes bacterium]|nr:N-acetylglucosamine-6-phosphate deacetylase [Bacteroidota bacterium]
MIHYLNARIYTGQEILGKAHVSVENGHIQAITTGPAPAEGEKIDLSGRSLAPALIDLQVYGGQGKLFNNEPNVDTIRATRAATLAGGAAYFQITLSCSPLETMWKAIDACREYLQSGGQGLLGLHLEGPYFNPEKRGAHPLQHIRTPHPDEVAELIERGKGIVRYMTLAPERVDDASLDLLLQSGICLSAGHSNATFEEAMHGFRKGISRTTHLFNAMSQMQSRAPGLVGATYLHKPWTSIIADGIHCDYNCLNISKQLLGERLFLISDAVTDSKSGDYRFHFAGDRYTDDAGVLAGSSLTMWQAVKNAVQHAGIPLDEALRMASTYPAHVVGVGEKLGKIAPGYEASMIVWRENETPEVIRLYTQLVSYAGNG